MALWSNVQFKIPVIQLVNFCNCFSNHKMKRPKAFFPSIRSNFPKRENKSGTMVNEVTKESNVAIITTTQNCLKILDTNPELMAIGKNTTTITKVMDTTVKPISLVASKEARTLFLPISICRWIFSNTTIASSTRIPTTNESPSNDIRLSVKPIRLIPIKVAINEAGIDTITIMALRILCKKNSITKATKITAKNKSCITASADSKVKTELSFTILISRLSDL
ncbi:hypothetical protein D9M68_590720 [compost metagenome]